MDMKLDYYNLRVDTRIWLTGEHRHQIFQSNATKFIAFTYLDVGTLKPNLLLEYQPASNAGNGILRVKNDIEEIQIDLKTFVIYVMNRAGAKAGAVEGKPITEINPDKLTIADEINKKVGDLLNEPIGKPNEIGYYWIYWEAQWIDAYWDGEDWNVHDTTFSYSVPYGTKWDAPEKPRWYRTSVGGWVIEP